MAEPLTPTLKDLDLKVSPGEGEHADKLSRLMSAFLMAETYYGTRNTVLASRRGFFDGDHWAEAIDETEEGEFRLVYNYCRRVVLDFAGMLARAPTPNIPTPPPKEGVASPESKTARRREDLLRFVWDDFLEAWRRAELNAAKCAYGVLEILWDDFAEAEASSPPSNAPQPTEGEEGPPEPETPKKRYSKVPYIFRSIKPENFYPIYRTFDRSDDFLYVFRFDPGRLVTDLEHKYGVTLKGSDVNVSGAEKVADLIEYWDGKYYVLVARTMIEAPPSEFEQGQGVGARFRRAVKTKLESQEPTTIPSYSVLVANEHKYPRIPFWVLQNLVNPDYDPTIEGSVSDIEDINVLNQHLNLMRSEQAEEIITKIHPPIVYSSPDHSQVPQTLSFTAAAVYPIREDEDLKTLEIATQPEFIKNHIADTERAIRTLSFLGDAGFGDFASGTSGVAARIALTPMQRILELKLPPRVYTLKGVASFILRCFEDRLPKDAKLRGWVLNRAKEYSELTITAEDIDGQYTVAIEYGNLLPRDDDTHRQNEAYLRSTGSQSLYTYLDNTGHPDPQAEIDRIKAENQDPWLNPTKWLEVQQAVMEKKRMEEEFRASRAGPEETPVEGVKSTAANVLPAQQFPRAPNAGGAGAGQLTPFLPRGGAETPQMAPGPGVNVGGMG